MKYGPWLLLTLGFTLNAQTPVTAVANTIRNAVDTRHAAESVERVYSTDRWFTFPAFEKTAAYLESRLKQVGLENIEIGGAIGRRRDTSRFLDHAPRLGRHSCAS